jgi:hypothetical protein
MIAKVTPTDKPGKLLEGRLANLSAHGISLILPSELPAGTNVNVQWGTVNFRGQIIYCEPHGKEFRAGLQVEEPIYDATLNRKDEKSATSPS